MDLSSIFLVVCLDGEADCLSRRGGGGGGAFAIIVASLSLSCSSSGLFLVFSY